MSCSNGPSASCALTVEKINIKENQQVDEGFTLMEMEKANE